MHKDAQKKALIAIVVSADQNIKQTDEEKVEKLRSTRN